MAPAERGVECDPAALGRPPETDAVGQGLSVGEPGIAAMQLREWWAGQRIEGLAALDLSPENSSRFG